jgi:hypothetical protein
MKEDFEGLKVVGFYKILFLSSTEDAIWKSQEKRHFWGRYGALRLRDSNNNNIINDSTITFLKLGAVFVAKALVSDYEDPNLPGCYLLREVNESSSQWVNNISSSIQNVSSKISVLVTFWLGLFFSGLLLEFHVFSA